MWPKAGETQSLALSVGRDLLEIIFYREKIRREGLII